MSKKSVADDSEPVPCVLEDEQKAWDPRDQGRFAPRPRAAYAELARYIDASANEELATEEWNARITGAWHLVSLDILESHGLLPAAASVMLAVLRVQEGSDEFSAIEPADALKDPQTRAAFDVARVALEHIAGGNGYGADVMRMAQALDRSSADVRRRKQVREVMTWTADPRRCNDYASDREWLDEDVDDDEEDEFRSPAEHARSLRAAVINNWLSEVDPRLALPPDVGEALIKLHDRVNSANHLAADWAWRAGIETTEPGESLTDGAPERIVKLYRDTTAPDRMKRYRASMKARTKSATKRGHPGDVA